MRPLYWLILLVVVAAVAGAIGFDEGKKEVPEVPHRQFTIEHDQLSARFSRSPAISPDGRRIAYVAGESLWIRDLGSLKPTEAPESTNPVAPFWSPDSRWVGWYAGGNLYKMPVGGGQPVVLCKLGELQVHAATWGNDGFIYLSGPAADIRAVADLGGQPRSVVKAGEGGITDFHTMSTLPGDRGILYTVHGSAGADTVEALTGGERKVVLSFPGERIEGAAYDARGFLVFGRHIKNTGLWAVPFSLEKMETTGEPVLVDPLGNWPSLSREGTLVYVQGAESSSAQLVFVDRQGQETETLSDPQVGMGNPVLSWDGTRALVSAEEGGNRDIWVHDLQRRIPTRMTFEESADEDPAWLPGDWAIAYNSRSGDRRSSLMVRRSDGSGQPWTLAENGTHVSFTQEGPYYAFSRFDQATAWNIWYGTMTPEGTAEGAPEEFLGGPGRQYDIQISPDGSLLAYADRISGREEIYITEFPDQGGRWQVSSGTGYWVRWSRKGDELYYIEETSAGYSLVAVKVERSDGLRLSTPRELFNDRASPGLNLNTSDCPYDPHPDGKRFLFTRIPSGERQVQPVLVVNQTWTAAFGEGER